MSEHQQIAELEERIRLLEKETDFLRGAIIGVQDNLYKAVKGQMAMQENINTLIDIVQVQSDAIETLQKLMEVEYGRK